MGRLLGLSPKSHLDGSKDLFDASLKDCRSVLVPNRLAMGSNPLGMTRYTCRLKACSDNIRPFFFSKFHGVGCSKNGLNLIRTATLPSLLSHRHQANSTDLGYFTLV